SSFAVTALVTGRAIALALVAAVACLVTLTLRATLTGLGLRAVVALAALRIRRACAATVRIRPTLRATERSFERIAATFELTRRRGRRVRGGWPHRAASLKRAACPGRTTGRSAGRGPWPPWRFHAGRRC